MPRPLRPLALALAGVLALTAASCNGGEPDAQTTTTAVAPPTAPATTTKAVPPSPLLDTMAPLVLLPGEWGPDVVPIFEAYVRAEQAVIKAAMDPVDPDDPQVAATHANPRLPLTKQSLADLRNEGHWYGLPAHFIIEPRIISAKSQTEIVFYTCFTLYQPLLRAGTKDEIRQSQIAELKAIGMDLIDGSWRVTLRTQKPEWEGKTCAEALLTVRP